MVYVQIGSFPEMCMLKTKKEEKAMLPAYPIPNSLLIGKPCKNQPTEPKTPHDT